MKTDLKTRITNGETPMILTATASADDCFGDLVAIGFAEQHRHFEHSELIDIAWTYTGPGQIRTNDGRLMKAGDVY